MLMNIMRSCDSKEHCSRPQIGAQRVVIAGECSGICGSQMNFVWSGSHQSRRKIVKKLRAALVMVIPTHILVIVYLVAFGKKATQPLIEPG
jgi:hypothetical protein